MLGNIQNHKLKRSRASNFDMSAGSKKDKDGKDFDYNKYSKDNHLDSLAEVIDFAKDHHLFMRNL